VVRECRMLGDGRSLGRYWEGAWSKDGSAPFLPYIHKFRAVAIVCVVASHINLSWSSDSIAHRTLASIVGNGSALFLLVSGFLFQHLSSRFTYVRYLKTKLQNVILPYLVCSIPALLYQWSRHVDLFGPTYPRHTTNDFVHALLAITTGAHMPAPLWFIPMIAVLYLASPALIAIDRRPRLYWIIVPMVIVAVFGHRPKILYHTGHALIYFTPAYLVGMWMSHYRDRVMRFVDAHLLGLLTSWLAVEIVRIAVLKSPGPIFSQRMFSAEAGIVDTSLVSKLFLAFGLVGFLARYEGITGRKLDYLAGASFEVFFIHVYIVDRVGILAIKLHHPKMEGSIAAFVGLLALYLLTSLVVVAIVRKLAGKRSRYLIGC